MEGAACARHLETEEAAAATARLRSRALTVAVGVAGLVLVLSPGFARAASVPNATLTLRLTTKGVPTAHSTVAVAVPASWKQIGQLEETAPGDPRWRALVKAVLKRVGLGEFQRETVVELADRPAELSSEHGTAHLKLVMTQRLGYWQNVIVGPWVFSTSGHDLVFRLEPYFDEHGKLPAERNVRVLGGPELAIVSSTRGAEVEPGSRSWTFARGQTLPNQLEVRTHPSARVRNALSLGAWRELARAASRYLSIALVPLFVLYLGRRRNLLAVGGAGKRAAGWASRIAAALLAVLAGELAAFTFGWVASRSLRPSELSNTLTSAGERSAAAAGVAVACAFLLGRRPALRAFLAAVGFVACVVGAEFLIGFADQSPPPAFLDGSIPWAVVLGFAVAVALGATFAVACALSILRLVRDTTGFALTGPIARAASLPAVKVAALVLVILLTTGYWLASVYHDFDHLSVDERQPFAVFINFYPGDIATPAQSMLSLLLLAALLSLAATAAANATTAVLGESRPAMQLALAILFGGYAVGMAGSVWGIALPLPAAAAAVTVWFVLRPRLEQQQAEYKRLNPDPDSAAFGGEEFHREMLTRARALAALRREEQRLDEKYRNADLTADAYDRELQAAYADEERIRTGQAAVPASSPSSSSPSSSPSKASPLPARTDVQGPLCKLPTGTSPYSYALSLGPASNWRGNARLAGGAATLLGLVPLAYYWHSYDWNGNRFGPFLAVVDTTGELAAWLVAGVVLGCCYAYLPGRVGAIRALLLVVAAWLALILLRLNDVASLPKDFPSKIGLITVVLVVVGIGMDWRTLSTRRLTQHLGDLYELHRLKRWAVFTPLAFVLLTIVHEIAIGRWNAVQTLVEDLAQKH